MIELFYITIKNLTSQGTLANWQQKKAALYRTKDDYLRSVASSLLINTVLFDRLPAPLGITENLSLKALRSSMFLMQVILLYLPFPLCP